jgi:hypothetical protein
MLKKPKRKLQPYYTYAYQEKETIKTWVTLQPDTVTDTVLNAEIIYDDNQGSALKRYQKRFEQRLIKSAQILKIIPTYSLN